MKAYPAYKKTDAIGIGDIPDHWNVILFKRLYSVIKDGTHGTFERLDEGQPLLSAKNVFQDGIRIDSAESLISDKDYKEIISNGFPKKDDLLLTIVGSIGRSFVYDRDEPLAFQRSVLFIRLRKNLNPHFYCYLVQSAFFQYQLIGRAKTSAQSGIYMKDIAETFAVSLPLSEQQAIADFLDRKTAQIDTLIAKKQRQIDLLQEQRTALINHVITKGLNPSARMKDSGVAWLGEIPSHWMTSKVKFEFDNLDYKRVPLSGEVRGTMKSRIYDYYGASGVIDKVDEFLFDETLILLGEDGANLVTRSKPLAFLASGKYWVNNHAHILKPKRGNIHYLVNILEAVDYFPLVTGAAQPKLTADNLENVKIPIPPIDEQNKIMDFINKEEVSFEKEFSLWQKQIELLQEYRTALISEAVTGKIDVRV